MSIICVLQYESEYSSRGANVHEATYIVAFDIRTLYGVNFGRFVRASGLFLCEQVSCVSK